MKQTIHFLTRGLVILVVCYAQQLPSFAQGTAFTYQGRLNDGASPANGIYDSRFAIYDSSGGPGVVAGPMTNSPVTVSNGLFTVTLDPGAGVFTGAERWLEIAVRTNSGGVFTVLSPRQPLTAAPYAVFAPNAGTAASVAANVIGTGELQASAVTADKIADGTITAADVNVATFSNTFWQVVGNAGTMPGAHFLGTTDQQPLEFRVNGLPALRLEPGGTNSPNVIGGFGGNSVLPGFEGAVIAGGGLAGFSNTVASGYSAIGGGARNFVAGSFSGIGAGLNNVIQSNANSSVVGGGNGNVIATDAGTSVIVGGFQNVIGTNSDAAAIGGGWVNEIAGNAAYAMVGGGRGNVAGGLYAVVPGGRGNTASGDYSVALGRRAKAIHAGALVLADATDADVSSTTTNELTIRASGGVRVLAGGAGVMVDNQTVFVGTNGAALTDLNASQLASGTVPDARLAASVARTDQVWLLGGNAGTSPGTHFLGTTDNQPLELKVGNTRALRLELNGGDAPNLIGGAPDNSVAATTRGAIIAGGKVNLIGTDAHFSVVGGGGDNSVGDMSASATIAGGFMNNIGTNAPYSAIGGGTYNRIRPGASYAAVVGGYWNYISTNAQYSAIGAGTGNFIGDNSTRATIAGGEANRVNSWASYSTIGGGHDNFIADNLSAATIAGGVQNAIGAGSSSSVIGGGYDNLIAAESGRATIAGGYGNGIGTNSTHAVIGGGYGNSISANANYGTVPGGRSNSAASYAFAAGNRAKANHTGAFVWADSQNADYTSTAANQFLIRAAGGVGIGTTAPTAPLHVQSGSVGVDLNSRTVLGVERAGDTFIQVLTTTSNYAGVVFGSAYNSLDASVRYNAWGKRDLSFRTDNGTRMIILTNGYVGIANTSPTNLLMVSNARCDGSSWINASDRRLKQDFAPVDPQAVLEKVVSLPVQQWSYQAQPDQKHLGPVAQDFRAAFGLGADDTSIATVDADGVALTAIQGLNQKLEEQLRQKDAQLAAQQQQITALLQRLGVLEQKLNASKSR